MLNVNCSLTVHVYVERLCASATPVFLSNARDKFLLKLILIPTEQKSVVTNMSSKNRGH